MSDFVKSTAVLTEHLGYAPIALIDDIINAVNDILYKCTGAMETFLKERYANADEIPSDEIQLGTAKLETLLESVVDRCFDKFELYALRNLLVIPPDLISEGWIRLKHHAGIDFSKYSESDNGQLDNNNSNNNSNNNNNNDNDDLQKQIVQLRQQIYNESHMNFLRTTQLRRILKMLKILENYRTSLLLLVSPNDESAKQALNDIAPLNETLLFLSSQVTDMIAKTSEIQNTLTDGMMSSIKQPLYTPRDDYVDMFAGRAIGSVGINGNGSDEFKNEEEAEEVRRIMERILSSANEAA